MAKIPDTHTARTFLTDLFHCAVDVADPMKVVPGYLPPKPAGRLVVIGAGKASARMAEAVEAHYGPCDGLIITRYGYARPCESIEIAQAAHPVPDIAGETATRKMLEIVAPLGADDTVIALISGGGSALLCAPREGLTLNDKITVNRALLASGAPIGDMNIVRKHLSRVKGGQLAAACYPAKLFALSISDVPGDDPSEIASGPTVGENSTSQDALDILHRHRIDVPEAVTRTLSQTSTVISPTDPRLSKSTMQIIAAPSHSLKAAAILAEASGCDTRILGDALEGEARDLARDHAKLAIDLISEVAASRTPVLLLSGGECTVTRRGNGIGGPNAEYTLAAMIALKEHPNIHVLACDTDGVDGAAEIAGAYCGPETQGKAHSLGIDPQQALNNNDAHSFFARLDSQIVTGPTLTNVNDFRAILILPDAP